MSGIAGLDKPNQHVGRRCPKEDIEAVHRIDSAHGQVDRRCDGSDGRQNQGESAATELCQEAGEEDRCGTRQGGKETEGKEGIAEEAAVGGEEVDRKRRLIDVAKVEVLTAGDVIKLISENSVASPEVGDQMEEELEQRKPHKDEKGAFRLGVRRGAWIHEWICCGG